MREYQSQLTRWAVIYHAGYTNRFVMMTLITDTLTVFIIAESRMILGLIGGWSVFAALA